MPAVSSIGIITGVAYQYYTYYWSNIDFRLLNIRVYADTTNRLEIHGSYVNSSIVDEEHSGNEKLPYTIEGPFIPIRHRYTNVGSRPSFSIVKLSKNEHLQAIVHFIPFSPPQWNGRVYVDTTP